MKDKYQKWRRDINYLKNISLLVAGLFVCINFSGIDINNTNTSSFFKQSIITLSQKVLHHYPKKDIARTVKETTSLEITASLRTDVFSGICDVDLTSNAVFRTCLLYTSPSPRDRG